MESVSGERNLLSNEIGRKLKELILKGTFKPGDKLPNENELAELMSVGRSTVREAIKSLVSQNVLEVVRGKGTYVAAEPGLQRDPLGMAFIPDNNLLLMLFETRILIEPGVASLAAERATESDLAKLESCINQMVVAVNESKIHLREDLEFHKTIALSTKNPIIHRIVPIIIDSIARGYDQTVHVPGSALKATEAHRRVFEAIKNRRPDQANLQMKRHLEEAMSDITATN